MKPFVKTLLVAFAGALIGAALVAGICFVHHLNENEIETEASDMPIDKRFFAYFDENGIPYQKYDSAEVYAFEYENRYYLIRVSTEEEFVRILAFGDTVAGADYLSLLEAANETLIEHGGANVVIVNKKGVMFTIDHMVDNHTDVAKMLPVLVTSIEINREAFYEIISEQ